MLQKQQAHADVVVEFPGFNGYSKIRREGLRLLADWRGLLGRHVATSRQLLRKLLDRQRFVFYPQSKGAACWYELGVTPTLDKFFGALPLLKIAGTSPTGFEPVFWP